MKFGKAFNLENIDFSLPIEASENRLILQNANAEFSRIYIGSTAWVVPAWKGLLYPKKVRSNEYLYHYSRQFNSIELNTTHYRLPSKDQVQQWKDQVPEDFRFCPKVWNNISHRKSLGLNNRDIISFCLSVANFSENLGICFLQLPPYFGEYRLNALEALLRQWPREIPLAVEVRHESFHLNNHNHCFFDLCFKYGATALVTDVAGRRDLMHSRLTQPKAMIRWVGNGNHPTDTIRLRDWADRLTHWINQGIEEIYFFPHQTDQLIMPFNAKELYDLLSPNAKCAGRTPSLLI